jgi:hypothetical protein
VLPVSLDYPFLLSVSLDCLFLITSLVFLTFICPVFCIPDTGQRLQKTNGVIKNRQCRDTDNKNRQSRDTDNKNRQSRDILVVSVSGLSILVVSVSGLSILVVRVSGLSILDYLFGFSNLYLSCVLYTRCYQTQDKGYRKPMG